MDARIASCHDQTTSLQSDEKVLRSIAQAHVPALFQHVGTVSIVIRSRRLLCLVRNARDFYHGWGCQNLAQLAHPIASCLGRTKPTAAKVIKLIEVLEFDFVVQ